MEGERSYFENMASRLVSDDYAKGYREASDHIAAAIRALKGGQPELKAKCCHKTVLAHCEGCPYIPVERCGCFRCAAAILAKHPIPSPPATLRGDGAA